MYVHPPRIGNVDIDPSPFAGSGYVTNFAQNREKVNKNLANVCIDEACRQ